MSINLVTIKLNKTHRRRALCLALILAFWLCISWYYGLDFLSTPLQAARTLANHILAFVHQSEMGNRDQLRSTYWVGRLNDVQDPRTLWAKLESKGIRIQRWNVKPVADRSIVFVYADPEAGHLQRFRKEYNLAAIIANEQDEYHRILAMGKWIGQCWDHGTDPVPGGLDRCDPVEVIQAGNQGGRFDCHVSAKVTVQVATALGWPARMISASQDGYQLDHGIAEIWCNQLNKWILLDTDFNIVFEHDGIPLSAYELCHRINTFQQSNRLVIRRIARAKKNINYNQNLLDLYRYVHIDMRNDWSTRRLSPGNPFGGDLATWWTGRTDIGPLLTAKINVTEKLGFDWPVNTVSLTPISYQRDKSGGHLVLDLATYSPYFKSFQFALDDRAWKDVPNIRCEMNLTSGIHRLRARVRTKNSFGPVSQIDLQVR